MSFRLAATLAAVLPTLTFAFQSVRFSVDQRGDFLLIGNSGAYDCGNTPVVPLVGAVGTCGSSTGDSSGDILWRADAPATGQAQANNTITVANARTTAQLTLPVGATVTYARLYWSAKTGSTAVDTQVTLDRPGSTFTSTLTADATFPAVNNSYQASADVTALVQANGVGAYRVAGIDSLNPVNLNDNTFFVGWSMVIFYRLDSLPPRNLTLFDGFDLVDTTNSANVTLTGFVVPDAGYDGKLGIIAYEGDLSITGESFTFGGAPASNALNPVNNALNGTRSFLGAAVSNVGNLPQLTGGAGSVTGMDLDVFNVTAVLTPNQTSAPLTATSTGDVFIHGAFITSVSTLKPIFVNVQKTVTDLNGGDTTPGDVLEYVVTGSNSGTDSATGVTLSDPLPAGLTFVPGSIVLVSGGAIGPKTDAPGDDVGDYTSATRTVMVHLGAGATPTTGGVIIIGGSFEVRFRVTVDAGAPAVIINQVGLSTQGVVAVGLGLTTPIVYQSDTLGVGLRRPTPVTIVGDTTISSAPPLLTNSNSATFTFSTNVGGATFECSLDGAAFSACPTPTTLNGLADGSHTLQVRYRSGATLDATPASHTWVVDRTPPVAPAVTTPANGSATTNRRPGITGTAEPGSTVTIFIDGVSIGTTVATAGGAFSFTPTADLALGLRQVRATATDAAGNVSANSNTNSFTIDVTAPDTTIVTGPPAISNSTSATFTFSASEAVLRFECSLDGAAFVPCSTPSTFTGLAQGAHSLSVRAVDLAGNVDPTPALATWTVDTTAPTAPTVSAPANGASIATRTPTVTGTAEPNSTVTVFIDGVNVGTTSADAMGAWAFPTTTSLADGSHTVRATATDAAGNVSPSSAANTFSVLGGAPDTTLVSGPSGTVSSTTATFVVTSEPGATFECNLDGAGFMPCSATSSFPGLADGQHTIQIRAVNAAGTPDPTPVSQTWTVESSVPDTTITARPPSFTSDTTARFEFTATKSDATFECSLDSGAFVPCSSPLVTGTLTDGVHVLLVRAVDGAGRVDPTPAVATWEVDRTAPTAPVISEPVEGTVTGPLPSFGGLAEPFSTVTVTVGGMTVCTATASAEGRWSCITTTPLTAGAQTATATARDRAGNVSIPSLPRGFTVDAGAPDTVILTSPGPLTNTTSAAFTVGSDRMGATFECSLDGAAFMPCSASPSFTNLMDGSHVLEVRATQAGMTDASPAAHTWVQDSTAPAAPVITSPMANATTSSTPTYTGTAEPGSTVVVRVDGQVVCTTTADVMGAFSCAGAGPLAAGAHGVTATATDRAGNTSPAASTVPFTVVAELDTAIIAGPSGTVSSSTANFAFVASVAGATFECSLDGAPFTACPTPVTFSSLSEGSHTLEVRAVSGATVDATPASRTWVVDTIGPTSPVITSPTMGSTITTRTPTYSGTAEPGSTVIVSVDDVPVCTAVADASGAWSCMSPTPLSDGEHRVAAVAKDRAGNSSPVSMVTRFTVAGTPVTVAITSPADETLTNDATPTLSGTATPGATVTVSIDGVVVGTTTADANGTWTFTLTTALADGTHQVTAIAEFNGNTSPRSNEVTVRVDTTPPTVMVTVTENPPSRFPELTITPSELPVTTTCSLDGGAFGPCTNPLDLTGLAPGTHTLVVRVTDAAGNSSQTTQTFVVGEELLPAPRLVIQGGGFGCATTDGSALLLALLVLAARRSASAAQRR